MNKLLFQFLLQHRFDRLEIIRQVRTVNIRLLGYTHDRAHLAVLGLIHHHERLRYVAFIEAVDLLGNLWCQILVLETTATRIGVDHQTGIHHGVLILRETNNGLLELNTVRHDQVTNTVQTLDSLDLVRRADTRTKEYMTAVDTLAFLLDELDDMIAVLGLHDAAHTFRVIEVKRHFRELAYQLTATDKAQFSTALGTLRIFRIEAG